MKFRIRAYTTEAGFCPVREYLVGLRPSNQHAYAQLVAGIDKLRDRMNHRGWLSKPLPPYELFELRTHDHRVVYAFRRGQLIVLLLAVKKTRQELPSRTLRQAEEFRRDYEERCTNGEHNVDEAF